MNPLRFMADLWKRGILGADGITEDVKSYLSRMMRPVNARRMEQKQDREVARYHASQVRHGIIEPKRKMCNYGRPRRESWADTKIRECMAKKEKT